MDDRVVNDVTERGVETLVPSLDPATGMAASVTIVRAAPDVGSVRLSVNMPTAATSPVVVCANRRIENVPVTCGAGSAALTAVAAVSAVDVAAAAVCDGCAGVVGSEVVGGASGGVPGSVGVAGVSDVFNVPVIGIVSLADVA
jgi:hypothetical protein